ncbi:SURP and G-patch domain-containing protein 2 isoform X2 [Pyxicephalus adspersus]|uniref:SURP and G-patch domain-containing protein 2 n=1 Tax=Pyxicephalus adspersus TaxID=30357 RepID=A0AAV3AMG1_PYXAD|nr:TPA: hypothetical protein GDO54_008689 [Pyxicephalus adspersus]
MAGQRITRDMFDAVVQEKMKKYRISMDQAIANTVREFQLEGPSAFRDQERLSFRDLPRDSLSRKWETNMTRDSVSNPLYFQELGRESSSGLHSDPLMNRWGSADPHLKERLYREELQARDLDVSRRNWELERNSGPDFGMVRSDLFREFQDSELGPVKEGFWGQGRGPSKPTRGVMELLAEKAQGGQRFGSSGPTGKAGNAYSKKIPQEKCMPVSDYSFSGQIVRWAKFHNAKDDSEFQRQRKALFRLETETCKMAVNCFKGRLSVSDTELCFSSIKPINHPALFGPKIDNDLLDLLVATTTVMVKNDFFDAIKPYDKDMMTLQQRMLNCATPLILACNTFELKHPILTDPKQLHGILDNTLFLVRKSLVLLGQTFALATALRQNNVMEILGINGTELKPADFPNFKDSYLFGKDFITKLKDWLQKSGHKLTLNSRTKMPKQTTVNKEETKTEAESKERKSGSPNVVATIDQLLEYAKKADKGGGEKPAFWFLFDKNSNEYKYYQQKLEQFQNSLGPSDTKNTQITKAKKSTEELAEESVRAMLYARKALAVKKKLFGSLAVSRKRKVVKPKRQLPKTVKANKKLKKTSQKVAKKTLTQNIKKENVIQEVKEENVTAEVVKGTVSPTVKKEVGSPKKVKPEVKKEATVKPVQDASSEQSSGKLELKGQEEAHKSSTSAKDKSPNDHPSDVKAEISSERPQVSDVDEKTKDTAVKLAQFVVQMGPQIEEFSMQNSVNNPDFWFLREKNSPAYKYYKSKLEEFKREASSDVDDGDQESVKTGDEDVDMGSETPGSDNPSIAAFSQMPTPSRPAIPRKRVAKLKVGMLPAKRVCLVDEPKIHDPVRIAYECPKGRLNNRKKKPADLEFSNKKLTEHNVGFQMLNKMGWREGQGLGSSGSGIKNPIKVGAVSAGEGLGVEQKEPPQSKGDNFDAFRQRMMNMYKHKISK